MSLFINDFESKSDNATFKVISMPAVEIDKLDQYRITIMLVDYPEPWFIGYSLVYYSDVLVPFEHDLIYYSHDLLRTLEARSATIK